MYQEAYLLENCYIIFTLINLVHMPDTYLIIKG
jgi:hypothetical protein